MEAYKVYALVDEAGRILGINSDAFLEDATGWVLIDEGESDRHHHAQGNYFSKPLWDDTGVCRYKLEDGAVVERSEAEMQEDRNAMPAEPTMGERLAKVESVLERLLSLVAEIQKN